MDVDETADGVIVWPPTSDTSGCGHWLVVCGGDVWDVVSCHEDGEAAAEAISDMLDRAGRVALVEIIRG